MCKVSAMTSMSAQGILISIICKANNISKIWYSPDGSQLWLIGHLPDFNHSSLMRLDVAGDWSYIDSMETVSPNLRDVWSWLSPFSPHGYHIKIMASRWIMDSGGRKLLWLPPNWMAEKCTGAKWEGNLLTMLGSHNPVPVIIEFQEWYFPPHSC